MTFNLIRYTLQALILLKMKTSIAQLMKTEKMSPHLYYSLMSFERDNPEKYVEDITKKEFLALRGIGIKRWEEFDRLRNRERCMIQEKKTCVI